MKTDTENKLTMPTVHMNGTGLETLQVGYNAVDDALYDLTEAWGRVEFNPRDYYVQGPDAWDKALK